MKRYKEVFSFYETYISRSVNLLDRMINYYRPTLLNTYAEGNAPILKRIWAIEDQLKKHAPETKLICNKLSSKIAAVRQVRIGGYVIPMQYVEWTL